MATSLARAIILFGPPGGGKGTQAKLLAQKLGMMHITTGGLIRERMENDASFRKKYSEHLSKGKLLGTKLIMNMLNRRLKELQPGQKIILDGVPRTKRQAELIDQMLARNGFADPEAIRLDVNDDTVLERIIGRSECSRCHEGYNAKFKPSRAEVEHTCEKCGGMLVTRHDDKPESIGERLDIYHKKTEPAIRHYQRKGVLSRIVDEGQGIQRIHEQAIQVLASRRK